jgi:GNAT superfamily N-acetyltransferase
MVALRRTTSRDPAFVELTRRLDRELRDRYGELQDIYAAHNEVDSETALVAELDGEPVGCACFKRFDATTVELKRMFVAPERRWHGIGRAMVREIEAWAAELGSDAIVLETGVRQPEAIELYESCGFTLVDNFAPYVGLDTSVCFRKPLR